MATPTPEKIAWKDEGQGGPVWINDEPVGVRTELEFLPVWFTRMQAEALARFFGLELRLE